MSAFTQKKYRFYFKLSSFHKFLALTFSLIYGALIIFLLNLQHQLGSGDIASYLHFFGQFSPENDAPELSIQQDGAFRLSVFFLREFFGVRGFNYFKCNCIYNLYNSFLYIFDKYKIRKIFSLSIAFISNDFHYSNCSGIIFIEHKIGHSIYHVDDFHCLSQGNNQLVFFGLSSIVHFSMIPFIGLYILFHLQRSFSL